MVASYVRAAAGAHIGCARPVATRPGAHSRAKSAAAAGAQPAPAADALARHCRPGGHSSTATRPTSTPEASKGPAAAAEEARTTESRPTARAPFDSRESEALETSIGDPPKPDYLG